ncbi:endonuclease/exonuclease/phosphatase family protein [Sphingomonas gilva]|uniref:Endonuclease/exonuclease/phosphatase family protein n=1 Tax=Sphingomonas gilva TaxID=2305907 RepID=A0A396RQW0_9SPHN|nr:endonuclease/exonuclease/phosphatase family protein [Sphingomonas gilva]RHW18366.1 endonuclease/exonuclease/phosphatase family protein [Sphingomonas gilva]
MSRLTWISLAVAALCQIMLGAGIAQARDGTIEVMSFNVRLPIDKGVNSWERRRGLAAEMIRRIAPDVIGTQELHKRQGDDIVRLLPAYGWIGIDRRGGHDDEHMGLFYRRDRLNLIEFGNFWLSDTPDVPGSISWGHPLPRMTTWALFETKDDKRRFYVLNTHFPYRAEDEDARMKGALMLRQRIDALPADIPVVLTGDFNTTPDSQIHAALTERLADVRIAAPSRSGPDDTFHNFTGKADRRIDWILTRGLDVRSTQTVTDHRGEMQTSDHFPIVATLAWPTSR